MGNFVTWLMGWEETTNVSEIKESDNSIYSNGDDHGNPVNTDLNLNSILNDLDIDIKEINEEDYISEKKRDEDISDEIIKNAKEYFYFLDNYDSLYIDEVSKCFAKMNDAEYCEDDYFKALILADNDLNQYDNENKDEEKIYYGDYSIDLIAGTLRDIHRDPTLTDWVAIGAKKNAIYYTFEQVFGQQYDEIIKYFINNKYIILNQFNYVIKILKNISLKYNIEIHSKFDFESKQIIVYKRNDPGPLCDSDMDMNVINDNNYADNGDNDEYEFDDSSSEDAIMFTVNDLNNTNVLGDQGPITPISEWDSKRFTVVANACVTIMFRQIAKEDYTNHKIFVGSGVAIGPFTVLTAAHCVAPCTGENKKKQKRKRVDYTDDFKNKLDHELVDQFYKTKDKVVDSFKTVESILRKLWSKFYYTDAIGILGGREVQSYDVDAWTGKTTTIIKIGDNYSNIVHVCSSDTSYADPDIAVLDLRGYLKEPFEKYMQVEGINITETKVLKSIRTALFDEEIKDIRDEKVIQSIIAADDEKIESTKMIEVVDTIDDIKQNNEEASDAIALAVPKGELAIQVDFLDASILTKEVPYLTEICIRHVPHVFRGKTYSSEEAAFNALLDKRENKGLSNDDADLHRQKNQPAWKVFHDVPSWKTCSGMPITPVGRPIASVVNKGNNGASKYKLNIGVSVIEPNVHNMIIKALEASNFPAVIPDSCIFTEAMKNQLIAQFHNKMDEISLAMLMSRSTKKQAKAQKAEEEKEAAEEQQIQLQIQTQAQSLPNQSTERPNTPPIKNNPLMARYKYSK